MSNEFIPLLSKKQLEEFLAEEYKKYVRGLYWRKPKKKTVAKVKTQQERTPKGKVLKNGKISITTSRKPKYITEEEVAVIAGQLNRDNSLIIESATTRKITITSHESAKLLRPPDETKRKRTKGKITL